MKISEAAILVLLALVTGALFGNIVAETSFEKDCNTLGKVRFNSDVPYTCTPPSKEIQPAK